MHKHNTKFLHSSLSIICLVTPFTSRMNSCQIHKAGVYRNTPLNCLLPDHVLSKQSSESRVWAVDQSPPKSAIRHGSCWFNVANRKQTGLRISLILGGGDRFYYASKTKQQSTQRLNFYQVFQSLYIYSLSLHFIRELPVLDSMAYSAHICLKLKFQFYCKYTKNLIHIK